MTEPAGKSGEPERSAEPIESAIVLGAATAEAPIEADTTPEALAPSGPERGLPGDTETGVAVSATASADQPPVATFDTEPAQSATDPEAVLTDAAPEAAVPPAQAAAEIPDDEPLQMEIEPLVAAADAATAPEPLTSELDVPPLTVEPALVPAPSDAQTAGPGEPAQTAAPAEPHGEASELGLDPPGLATLEPADTAPAADAELIVVEAIEVFEATVVGSGDSAVAHAAPDSSTVASAATASEPTAQDTDHLPLTSGDQASAAEAAQQPAVATETPAGLEATVAAEVESDLGFLAATATASPAPIAAEAASEPQPSSPVAAEATPDEAPAAPLAASAEAGETEAAAAEAAELPTAPVEPATPVADPHEGDVLAAAWESVVSGKAAESSAPTMWDANDPRPAAARGSFQSSNDARQTTGAPLPADFLLDPLSPPLTRTAIFEAEASPAPATAVRERPGTSKMNCSQRRRRPKHPPSRQIRPPPAPSLRHRSRRRASRWRRSWPRLSRCNHRQRPPCHRRSPRARQRWPCPSRCRRAPPRDRCRGRRRTIRSRRCTPCRTKSGSLCSRKRWLAA